MNGRYFAASRSHAGLWLGFCASVALLPVGAAAEGVPVTAAPVEALAVARTLSAPAEVVAANRSVLSAQLSARIAAVEADVGARVAKGDVLVVLDDTDYALALRRVQANIAALEAQVEQARARLRRSESLAERQFASPDDLLERSTSLSVLERQLDVERVAADIARAELSRTRIRAPFDGEVVERVGQVGALATPGAALLTLTQGSGREVSATLNPRDAGSLAGVSARFNSGGGSFPVSVLRLASVIDADTRTQLVRLGFDEKAAPIGATGTLDWQPQSGLLPAYLLVQRGGELGVFVAEGGRARFHSLPEASEGRAAAHGLAAGTLVVVDGRARLQDGDPIDLRRP